jgi:hypothetical protein
LAGVFAIIFAGTVPSIGAALHNMRGEFPAAILGCVLGSLIAFALSALPPLSRQIALPPLTFAMGFLITWSPWMWSPSGITGLVVYYIASTASMVMIVDGQPQPNSTRPAFEDFDPWTGAKALLVLLTGMGMGTAILVVPLPRSLTPRGLRQWWPASAALERRVVLQAARRALSILLFWLAVCVRSSRAADADAGADAGADCAHHGLSHEASLATIDHLSCRRFLRSALSMPASPASAQARASSYRSCATRGPRAETRLGSPCCPISSRSSPR